MFKLYILLLLILTGCTSTTFKATPSKPLKIIVDKRKEIENYLSDSLSNTNKINIKSSHSFLDPKKHDVIWLITFNNINGSTDQWFTRFIGYLENGGIWFADKNGNIIKLHKQFNYMLIRYNGWIHQGWKEGKEIILNPMKNPPKINPNESTIFLL